MQCVHKISLNNLLRNNWMLFDDNQNWNKDNVDLRMNRLYKNVIDIIGFLG